MDERNIGDILKKLDNLDAKDYAFSNVSSGKMTENSTKNSDENNSSDFDNSDEDLADLLDDEDENDAFAKSTNRFSPSKTIINGDAVGSIKTSPAPRLKSDHSAGDLKPKDAVDNILECFVDSRPFRQSSPPKTNSLHFDKNTFSSVASTDHHSSAKFLSVKNRDLHNTTEKVIAKTSQERRGSFFDDILQKFSPKKKNGPLQNTTENDSKDGSQIPSVSAVYTEVFVEPVVDSLSKRNLQKQVSFISQDEDLVGTDDIQAKSDKKAFNSGKLRSVASNVDERNDKVGSSLKDDIDWENFFKEVPKEFPKSSNRKDSIGSDSKGSPVKSDYRLKRKSSASWLGLNESLADTNDTTTKKSKEKAFLQIKSSLLRRTETSLQEHDREKSLSGLNLGDFGQNQSKPVMSDVVEKRPLLSTSSKKNVFDLKTSQLEDASSELLISNNSKEIQSLQTQLDESVQEKQRLIKENENTKELHGKKIKEMEQLSSLKQEFENKIHVLEERCKLLSQEKEDQAVMFKERISNLTEDHKMEMQRLMELHKHSIDMMKKDNEDAFTRLQQLKNQEVDCMLSSQTHWKSLKYLTDQLGAQANELALLHKKLEGKNQVFLSEKQSLLEAKETNLKALERKLQKEYENSESERTRLQQLILRLEGRLQKITMDGEEEHYEVLQMKAKFTVQQQNLEEERKMNQQHLEKAKERLQLSQNSLVQEQKMILHQLAQERQLLVQEKIDLQSQSKQLKEEQEKFNFEKLKDNSSIENQKQLLQQEKNQIYFEKEKVKNELYQLEREQSALLVARQEIKDERKKLHEFERQLQRKSAEVQEQTVRAALELEKGHGDYAEALKIKQEREHELKKYNQDLQILMEKERQILFEKDQLIKEKLELERMKLSTMCIRCKLAVDKPMQAIAEMPMYLPLKSLSTVTSQVPKLYEDPRLVLWHITAQKDQDFLEEELAYIKAFQFSSHE